MKAIVESLHWTSPPVLIHLRNWTIIFQSQWMVRIVYDGPSCIVLLDVLVLKENRNQNLLIISHVMNDKDLCRISEHPRIQYSIQCFAQVGRSTWANQWDSMTQGIKLYIFFLSTYRLPSNFFWHHHKWRKILMNTYQGFGEVILFCASYREEREQIPESDQITQKLSVLNDGEC